MRRMNTTVLEYLEFTQLSNLIGMLAKILHRFRVPGIYTALKHGTWAVVPDLRF